MGLVLYLIKKFIPNSGYFSTSQNLKIIQSISIGVRQKLILVQFFNKKILLSSTPSSIRKIESFFVDDLQPLKIIRLNQMIKYQYLKSFRFFVLILVFSFLYKFFTRTSCCNLKYGEGQTQYSLISAITCINGHINNLTNIASYDDLVCKNYYCLSLLRQALGTAQTPPNQVLIGLALFWSLFVMSPILQKSYETGVALV